MDLQAVAFKAIREVKAAVAAYDAYIASCLGNDVFEAGKADALAVSAARASENAALAGAAAGYCPRYDLAQAAEFYAIAGVAS